MAKKKDKTVDTVTHTPHPAQTTFVPTEPKPVEELLHEDEATRRMNEAQDRARKAVLERETSLADWIERHLAVAKHQDTTYHDALVSREGNVVKFMTFDSTRYEITVKTRQRNRR